VSGAPPVYQVLFHRAGPAWLAGMEFREQPQVGLHVGFMAALAEEGRLVLGGPFLDAASEGDVVGMAIVDFGSPADAAKRAAADPSLAAGLLTVEVRPWLAPMGR
jgi:uncharacterized protein YciI